jgi:dihydroorotate dehydrogenase electron transfer subunit
MNNMKPSYRTEIVYENIQIADGLFMLNIKGKFIGNPGQFYMLKSLNRELILPRPISIHYLDDERISFLYQVSGEGTKALSKLKYGDELSIMGPLGNGFDTESINGKVAIVAGGIGIAPMLYTVKNLKHCDITVYTGFRDKTYTLDKFKEFVKDIKISTESGVEGHKGYVTDLFNPELYDVVLCCGPEIMMNKVIKMCNDKKIPLYVSMEKHMACGVGACLVCTCKTKYGNKRTCKNGPVFLGEDIILG